MSATAQTTRMRVPDTASLLREAYPEHTAKHAARAAGVSHRTTEAWVAGRREPAGSVLLRMADACDRFAAVLETRLHARRDARRTRQDAARHRGLAAEPGETTLTSAPGGSSSPGRSRVAPSEPGAASGHLLHLPASGRAGTGGDGLASPSGAVAAHQPIPDRSA